MRSQYSTLLQQLRRAQESVKAVEQFENKMKMRRQVPRARAALRVIFTRCTDDSEQAAFDL